MMNLAEMATVFPAFCGEKNNVSLGVKHEKAAAERRKERKDRNERKAKKKDRKASSDRREATKVKTCKRVEKKQKKSEETKEIVSINKDPEMKLKKKKESEEGSKSSNKKKNTRKALKSNKNVVVDVKGMNDNQSGTIEKIWDTSSCDGCDEADREMQLNFDTDMEGINHEHMPEMRRLMERLGRFRSKREDDSLRRTVDEFYKEQEELNKRQRLEEERLAETENRQLEALQRKLIEEEERRKADLLNLEQWKAENVNKLKRSREEQFTKLMRESLCNQPSSLEKNRIKLLKKDNADLQDKILELEQGIVELTSNRKKLQAEYSKNDIVWGKIKCQLVEQSKYKYKMNTLRREVKTTRNEYLKKCDSCQAESATKNIFQKTILNILGLLDDQCSDRKFVESMRKFANKGGHKISQKRFNNVSQTCLESRKPSRRQSVDGAECSKHSQALGFRSSSENNIARTRRRSFKSGINRSSSCGKLENKHSRSSKTGMRGTLEKRNYSLPSKLNEYSTSSRNDYDSNTTSHKDSLGDFDDDSTLSSDEATVIFGAEEQLDCTPVASSPTTMDNNEDARRALFLGNNSWGFDMFLSDDSYESDITDDDENSSSSYEDRMYIASVNPIVRRDESSLCF